MIEMQHDDWMDEAKRLFGDDATKWRFVCPVCNTVQSIDDYREHTDLDMNTIGRVIAFSCIGRWARGGCEKRGLGPKDVVSNADDRIGCDYAGGGLFRLNPVRVLLDDGTAGDRFAFAP